MKKIIGVKLVVCSVSSVGSCAFQGSTSQDVDIDPDDTLHEYFKFMDKQIKQRLKCIVISPETKPKGFDYVEPRN